MIKTIPEATKVKKATLFHDSESDQYFLMHYDTEILRLNSKLEICLVRQCSNSSTRAIKQVSNYFSLNWNDVKSKMVPYRDFYKYPVGN